MRGFGLDEFAMLLGVTGGVAAAFNTGSALWRALGVLAWLGAFFLARWGVRCKAVTKATATEEGR